MFSFRSWTVIVGMFASWIVTSTSSFAQTASKAEDCNAPMRDPISYFTVGKPTRPSISRDGCWIFANSANGPVILHRSGGVIEQRQVLQQTGQVRGLTHDGKTLVVAAEEALFIDVDRVISGEKDVILGRATDSHFSARHAMGLVSSTNYLFLTQNETDWVSVIDLNKVRAGLSDGAIVGGFPTGYNAQMVLSPDEKYLYVSSGQSGGGGQIPLPPCTRTGPPLEEREGTILVVDVQRAMTDPRSAVIAGVRAGCGGPVDVSPDGTTLYLSDRLGDSLLAFDTRRVSAGVGPVLTAKVPVKGSKSVSVIDGGKKVVVKGSKDLTVIDATRIKEGADAILGTIPANEGSTQFLWYSPVTADGKTLIVEVESGLEIIDLERVPLEPVKKSEASR